MAVGRVGTFQGMFAFQQRQASVRCCRMVRAWGRGWWGEVEKQEEEEEEQEEPEVATDYEEDAELVPTDIDETENEIESFAEELEREAKAELVPTDIDETENEIE